MMNGKQMVKSTAIITFFLALNILVGLLTQIILAAKFGAKFEMDAYLAAVTLPTLIITVLMNSLRVTFVPVFIEYEKKENNKEAWRIAINFINTFFVILLFIAIVGVIFAPGLISLVVPGFSLMSKHLAIQLIRIMFPAIVFSGLAAVFSSLYYARQRFLLPSISPFLNSFVIFGCVLVLANKLGIRAVATGMIMGSFAQFLLLGPGIMKESKYKFSLNFRHPGVIRIGKLIIPLILASIFYKAVTLVDRMIASGLPEGSIAYLGYAHKAVALLVMLVSTGISLTILPRMSIYAAERNNQKLRETLSLAIRMAVLIVIPIIAGLVVLRVPLIQLILERGAFTNEATHAVALTLLCYSGAIFGLTLGGILTPTFYALQDVKTVVKVGVIGAILNITLDLILVRYFSYVGIAIALSIATLFSISLFLVILQKRLGGIGGLEILKSFVKIGASAILMMLSISIFRNFWTFSQPGGQVLFLGMSIALGLGIYVIITFLFRTREILILGNILTKNIRSK